MSSIYKKYPVVKNIDLPIFSIYKGLAPPICFVYHHDDKSVIDILWNPIDIKNPIISIYNMLVNRMRLDVNRIIVEPDKISFINSYSNGQKWGSLEKHSAQVPRDKFMHLDNIPVLYVNTENHLLSEHNNNEGGLLQTPIYINGCLDEIISFVKKNAIQRMICSIFDKVPNDEISIR